ncbi:hypothetical protein [Streptomyces sp. NBC_00893]|uniref:hypothetical protein n=1 Tax=Streptomyces sp. NBC_00893 TaxID=2975862 RepID=UPI002258E332|nr:hypothetical protein [Streptomyces sp. NBC_00893]MCX4844201.1 hypothetical protein [Streptomyces sp. NBC_00893]
MATVHRPTEIEASAVEVYRLELTEAEQGALKAAPEKFLRELLERDGHTVNRLLVDTRILNGGCPEGEYEVVHLLSPPYRRSDHAVRCIPLP